MIVQTLRTALFYVAFLGQTFFLALLVGLIAIMHNDVVMPFTKKENERLYFDQLKAALKRHPNTTLIWAHTGLGRVVQPPSQHIAFLKEILSDPDLKNVNFDISWDEVAKYILRNDATVKATADLINQYPDRFLMGTGARGELFVADLRPADDVFDDVALDADPETANHVGTPRVLTLALPEGPIVERIAFAFDTAVVTRARTGEVRAVRLRRDGSPAIAATMPARCTGAMRAARAAAVVACASETGLARWDLGAPPSTDGVVS